MRTSRHITGDDVSTAIYIGVKGNNGIKAHCCNSLPAGYCNSVMEDSTDRLRWARDIFFPCRIP